MDNSLIEFIRNYEEHSRDNTRCTEDTRSLIDRAKDLFELEEGENRCTILFFLSVLLNDIAFCSCQQSMNQWDWNQEDAESAVFYHRVLINNNYFSKLDSESKAQTYCNLASHLSWLGRSVEAIRIWKPTIFNIENKSFGLLAHR